MTPPPPPVPVARHAALSRGARRRVAERLRRGIRELDEAYTISAGPTEERLQWDIAPEPVLVEPEEWSAIESAVRQRARLANCLLADFYGKQETLRHRLLPPELVLADPYFRRACVGLEPGRPSPATLLRFDLMRTDEGRWVFLETFANTPIGTAFAVQNRRLTLQENDQAYAGLPEFRRVTQFPVRLLDHLRRLAPGGSDQPNVVVLTAGPQDQSFLEHSFLARKMGVPLARSGDLLVLEQRAYFKTVAGLVPVDVIYRRVNDRDVDPVTFSTDRLTGVPGLVAAIRAGRLAVANAIGSGVADNRALEAYLPTLLRFFLGERPVLPGAPTYYCGDVDQLAVVGDDDEGRLALVPAQSSNARLPVYHAGGTPAQRERALEALRRQPHAYVARAIPRPGRVAPPWGLRGRAETRLSCFALCEGRRVEVMPGGLLRFLPARRDADPPGWQVGATADVVVLAGESDPALPATGRPPERVRPLLLGSRAADNLFWAGRYAERAEATARMLSIIRDVGIEEISRRRRRAWFPVWRGMLEATGHARTAGRRGPAWFTPGLAWHMTLDTGSPSSLLHTVRAARDNTLQCREFFSPETWGVLNRLSEALEARAARPLRTSDSRQTQAAGTIGDVLDGLAAFFGTVDRTMLHDTGWHFFQIGMHLERAVMTTSSLRHVLVEAESAARRNRREEADLTALVRMLSSLDAYRRTYQARTEPLFVAELFLLNRHAPKSVYACVAAVRDCLAAISSLTGVGDDAPLPEARAILSRLDRLDLERTFSRRTDSPRFEEHANARKTALTAVGRMLADHVADPGDSLARWLDGLLDQLNALTGSLHDFYFSHQGRLAREPARAG